VPSEGSERCRRVGEPRLQYPGSIRGQACVIGLLSKPTKRPARATGHRVSPFGSSLPSTGSGSETGSEAGAEPGDPAGSRAWPAPTRTFVVLLCVLRDLWAGEKITSGFRIPSSRRLRPLLNREILTVALLRLRFRSIVATESDANPGANSRKLFFRRPSVVRSISFSCFLPLQSFAP